MRLMRLLSSLAICSLTLYSTAIADDQVPPSPQQLLQGRWDSVSYTPEGEEQPSNEWAESFEFRGEEVISHIYPSSTTPDFSLFARVRRTPSRFALMKSEFNDRFRISIRTPSGSESVGTLYLDGSRILLTLGENSRGNGGTGYSVLAVKAPAANARNLEAEDLKLLRGEWHVRDDHTRMIKFIHSGVKVHVVLPGSVSGLVVTLDPSKTPKTIDETGLDGVPKQGIYSLDGDSLRICIASNGKPRPTAFKSLPDGQLCFELIRSKPIAAAK